MGCSGISAHHSSGGQQQIIFIARVPTRKSRNFTKRIPIVLGLAVKSNWWSAPSTTDSQNIAPVVISTVTSSPSVPTSQSPSPTFSAKSSLGFASGALALRENFGAITINSFQGNLTFAGPIGMRNEPISNATRPSPTPPRSKTANKLGTDSAWESPGQSDSGLPPLLRPTRPSLRCHLRPPPKMQSAAMEAASRSITSISSARDRSSSTTERVPIRNPPSRTMRCSASRPATPLKMRRPS